MKVGYCSDLHLDFGYGNLLTEQGDLNHKIFVPADLIILAGDIIELVDATRKEISSKYHLSVNFHNFLKKLQERYQSGVIWVPGNHEYYCGRIDKESVYFEHLRNSVPGIIILQNDIINIGDTYFYGATLWANLSKPYDQYAAMTDLKDFKKIQHGHRKLHPSQTTAHHLHTVRGISEFLSSHRSEKKVVITHHSPSFKSSDCRFKDSDTAAAYSSNLDYLIEDCGPNFWIHGHIHQVNNYIIGKTNIITNPRGYMKYEPDLVESFSIKTFDI